MNSKDLKIEFFSTIDHLNDIEECKPKPLSQLIPDWWKKSGSLPDKTIKDCPSFIQMFKTAYVVPMWCDTEITVTNDGQVGVNSAHPAFAWETHLDSQFLDFAPKHISENTPTILKALSPWMLKTPKGYSSYQMPAFYDFNPDFTILPGIVNTDYHHEINQQVMINGKDKSFVIKRGDPLAIYFPFKREKFELETRNATRQDIDSVNRHKLMLFTKFKNAYSSMFRELD